MSNAVKIQIETNAKTVEKDLEKVNQKVKTLQKRNTLQNGLNNLNSINQLSGMNDIGLGKGLSALTSNIGSVNKLMNPWSAAIVACIAATKALYAHANKMVEQGMPTANETEKLNAQLASQFGAKGMINGSEIIKQFQLMSENGVASTEQLVTAFSRLLPVLNGNSDKAVEFVKRMADVEAATGISADSITSLIAQIEASGEVEDKMVKRLQKQNIPIYEALAKVYGTDIATVKEMSKAHKIGVEEMRQALMDATEMYAGTAEALSATTEGAKASMEAAKGRAYEGAASGHNAVMRDYYGERQKYYDELADDAEWQNQQKVIGETIAQIQLLGEKIGDFCDSVGDESVGLIARLYDWLTGSKAEGEMNERAAQQGMRDLYEKFGPSDIGFKDGITSAQAEEAAKQLTSMLEAEQAKFRLMVDKKDMASGSEREALTAGVIAQERYVNALSETREMMYRTISAAKVFEGIEKQKQEAEQKAAEAAENAEANDKMRKSAALLLEDANKIASAFEFDDCDKLVQRYEELNKRLLENEDLTKDEREELGKLKSPYEAILKLRDKEQDAQKKAAEQAKKEAEDRRKEEEKQQREAETRAKTGDELKRQAYESEDWNRSFDTLSRLLERLNSSDLSQAEKDSIYQTEFSKMMEAAQQAAVKSSKDAFEAGNLHSVKDFEFTNYEVDDKMLKTQQEMLKASEAAINYQKEIRDRLPMQIIAQ